MSKLKEMYGKPLCAVIILLTVILAAAFSGAVTVEAAQTVSDIRTWSDVQKAIDGSESGDTIILHSDVTAAETDTMFSIPNGKNITLDLNGYTLNRHSKAPGRTDGAVIQVESGSVLTVKDSSKAQTGKITGGYGERGGGIRNIGTLIIEGGCITGNAANESGGGIMNYGVLVLKGGTVSGNTAVYGGGVYNISKGTMTVDRNAVYGNTASNDADLGNDGTMMIIGGETVHFTAVKTTFDLLTVLPVLTLLIVLFFAVCLDNYLNKGQKRSMYLIIILVLTLVIQNYFDTWLYQSGNFSIPRTAVSIYGYAVRPAILAMFLHLINPEKKHIIVWAAVGVNAAIYMTALFSPLTFSYTRGYYKSGPLGETCLIVSALLFIYCIYVTLRVFRPKQKKETWIPFFALVLISLSVVLDYTVVYTDLPVSFLTIAIAISCMMYYIWLHLQYVREHERALQAEHRIQIMMTQIQPHFLFNTLTAIRALCVKDPQTAAHIIGLFSSYIRQNLESLNQAEVIPLSKEIEHTQIYTEIEMIRFPNIRVEYDIRDEDCCVPALTIQPLVENAIRHGVRRRKEGVVKIAAYREGNEHLIVIEDNGIGFEKLPAENTDGTHIGIRNVRERLEKMCRGTMTIDSRPGEGTKIILSIPDSKEMNK